jgi:hypothetical protein
MPTHPDPRLIPLLEKHGLSWEMFAKRGRPPKGVREKRSAIVTELHLAGTTWADMVEITGLSLAGVHRLTKAVWNPASKRNRQESAARVGRSLKGREKPWLSEQMRERWEAGDFDFHKGRVRSEAEREVLREAWAPERRKAASKMRKSLWSDPAYREPLLAFHRSTEERARRSLAQARRMAEDPVKWTRGRGQYVTAAKATNGNRFWVRSSYEVAAVAVLEGDSAVLSYTYERCVSLDNGKVIKPDFVVELMGGMTRLIEVKAAWVFSLPDDHKVSRRLALSHQVALDRGWRFAVWTEQEELKDALNNTA